MTKIIKSEYIKARVTPEQKKIIQCAAVKEQRTVSELLMKFLILGIEDLKYK